MITYPILINNQETLEFGHSLTTQIGEQLKAGFLMTDFYEDDWNGERVLDKFLPSFFATRAIKNKQEYKPLTLPGESSPEAQVTTE
jgi:hypothetical protein